MRSLFSIVMVSCVVGCVSLDMERLDEDPRSERSPDSVQVWSEKPDKAHRVIARIKSRSETVVDDIDHLRNKLVGEGAKPGSDAVILGETGKESTFLISATGQTAPARSSTFPRGLFPPAGPLSAPPPSSPWSASPPSHPLSS